MEIAKQLRYKNANQYPELANLCMEKNIPESVFDECLQVNIRRKTKDNLPNILLDGNELNLPGYYFLKLPIDDPRAYILGHYTACCQSMGGNSQTCVIDGITLPNNGFYVLLKANNNNIGRSDIFNDNARINYDKFTLVGQGYAWLNRNNNLVFDSWENLRPLVDDDVIVPFLKEFASRLTTAKGSDILGVNIGTGGKTPAI